MERDDVIAGIFEAIRHARYQGDPGNVLRGWLAVAKLTGLNKPETVNRATSAGGDALLAKTQGMTIEELLAGAAGV